MLTWLGLHQSNVQCRLEKIMRKSSGRPTFQWILGRSIAEGFFRRAPHEHGALAVRVPRRGCRGRRRSRTSRCWGWTARCGANGQRHTGRPESLHERKRCSQVRIVAHCHSRLNLTGTSAVSAGRRTWPLRILFLKGGQCSVCVHQFVLKV